MPESRIRQDRGPEGLESGADAALAHIKTTENHREAPIAPGAVDQGGI